MNTKFDVSNQVSLQSSQLGLAIARSLKQAIEKSEGSHFQFFVRLSVNFPRALPGYYRNIY